MAVNVTLTNPASLTNQPSALAAIANTNAAITAGFLDTLSRSGGQPNAMASNLDMNSNRIMNLPAPVNPNDPLRLADVATTTQLSVITNSLNNFYDVKALGAKGDGSTDDYTAINTAAQAAALAGGILYFPPGTYIIGTSLVISTGNGMSVLGCGPASILKAKNSSHLNILFQTTVPTTIVDMVFDGNQVNSGVTSNAVLYLNGSHNKLLSSEVRNAGQDGIWVGASGATQDFLIEGCYIHDNGSASAGHGTGIFTVGAAPSDLRIVSNRFENNYNTSAGSGPGPSAAFNGPAKNLLFVGNYCINNLNSNGGQVVFSDGGSGNTDVGFTCSGNLIRQTTSLNSDGTCGIECEASNGVIAGNIIIGMNADGIRIEGTSLGVTVSGNTLSVATGGVNSGISLISSGGTGPGRCNIRANLIVAGSRGISTQASVTGENTIEGNYVAASVVTPYAGLSAANTDAYSNNPSFLMRTRQTLNSGAGSGAGTLTNAPSAGNPTKWIAIDDNGVTRQIPAW